MTHHLLTSPQVKGAWEVVRMDLIGPLKATARQNQYVLTMTDLYSNWVAAEALQTNAASEVSAAIISKLYLFGMVRKIISDQGRDFVTEVCVKEPLLKSTPCTIHNMSRNVNETGLAVANI